MLQHRPSPWKKFSAFALLLLLTAPLAAEEEEIYLKYDADGNPVFTDRPGEGPAERIHMRRSNVYDAPLIRDPARQRQRTAEREDEAAIRYDVRITQPADEEGVRAPDGRVTVATQVEPALRRGHRLELLLNGEPHPSTASAGTFEFELFDRGENRLVVRVLDGQRELARSEPVTFHLLRRSLLHPPPANPAPNYRPPSGR